MNAVGHDRSQEAHSGARVAPPAITDHRRMVGDPVVHIGRHGGERDRNRDACLYAAAMMQKVGRLPGDLAGVDVHFDPPATLVFVAADASQAEIGRFVIPGRVLSYAPRAIALPAPEGEAP